MNEPIAAIKPPEVKLWVWRAAFITTDDIAAPQV
jgi:hypothetical protein